MDLPHLGHRICSSVPGRDYVDQTLIGESVWLPERHAWELSFDENGFGVLHGSIPASQ